ncbi:hypothetical protein R3P38DRAFT_2863623 [Favolaschia claudopus]|uniref:Uncharacterized protein n=1 Tax=Favolaschia claudopus TaxID=2862362 RepID=A0AAW0DHP7_9AGAR
MGCIRYTDEVKRTETIDPPEHNPTPLLRLAIDGHQAPSSKSRAASAARTINAPFAVTHVSWGLHVANSPPSVTWSEIPYFPAHEYCISFFRSLPPLLLLWTARQKTSLLHAVSPVAHRGATSTRERSGFLPAQLRMERDALLNASSYPTFVSLTSMCCLVHEAILRQWAARRKSAAPPRQQRLLLPTLRPRSPAPSHLLSSNSSRIHPPSRIPPEVPFYVVPRLCCLRRRLRIACTFSLDGRPGDLFVSRCMPPPSKHYTLSPLLSHPIALKALANFIDTRGHFLDRCHLHYFLFLFYF